jgi:rRNA maturation endonuclease Nob1
MRLNLDKDAKALIIECVREAGGFQGRINSLDHKALAPLHELATTHKTTVNYLVKMARTTQNVKVANRRKANGDTPGLVNYCWNCGAHLSLVRTSVKELKFCPTCGKEA